MQLQRCFRNIAYRSDREKSCQMKKTCILITCDYPYDTGETFIENEILYLSKSFEKIYIFPLNAHDGDKMTRIPPKNSIVFPVGCLHSRMRIPKYALRGLLARDPELVIHDSDIKHVLASLYARGRSEYVTEFIISTLRENNIDCSSCTIYSYWFTDQAVSAWKIKNRLKNSGANIKVVSRAHGYDLYWERNSAGYLPYQDISLKNLDGVFPCSDDGSNYLKRKYPSYQGKVHTERLGTIDHGLALEPEKTVFVTCCSLKGIKRISMFAEAFCKLIKTVPDAYWYCIGDGEEYELISKIVLEQHAQNNVKMVGRLSNQDVLEFYEKTPVSYFVNVSITEGVPVSIMEAMSFGIPVIATDAGGTGELVSETCGQIMSTEIDAQALLRVLENEVHISREEYKGKRRMARQIWERLSSAEKNYSAWCSYLSE